MPAKQYPFIDIAVHERVRGHFANGEATILFSTDLENVLWANGQGAGLFGHKAIYDLIDAGIDRTDVSFRQLEATARQLRHVGEMRNFLMRISSGFRRVTVNASVEIIRVNNGDEAVLFSAPLDGKPGSNLECAERMLSGFDDPDTHMAVFDGDGQILAASPGFAALGVSEQSIRMLVGAAGRERDWLVKRPIPTGKGQLPAAIGKISNAPALHLLFAVETILGTLDPSPEADEQPATDLSVAGAPSATPLFGFPDDEPGETTDDAGPVLQSEDADDLSDLARLDGTDEELRDAYDETPDDAETDAAEPVPATEDPDTGGPVTGAEKTEDAASPQQDDESRAPEDEPVQGDLASPAEFSGSTSDEASTGEPVEQTIPLAVSEPSTHLVGGNETGFRFDANGRATRFVWKIDAEGRFSEISDEFAATVGPRAAAISGLEFATVADRFGFDADHKIRELLQRRDTWSGKTIFWPVEGTNLAVPVDLAALPTYSRDREFDGFRGFGIVRVADAVADEKAHGLFLGGQSDASTTPDTPESDERADDTPETPLMPDDPTADAEAAIDADQDLAAADETPPATQDETTAAGSDDEQPEDVFSGESPVFRDVPPVFPAFSEKIIQLEERRARNAEGLTNGEQAAFREIARQLGGAAETGSSESDTGEDLTGPGSAEDGMAEEVHGQTADVTDEDAARFAEEPLERIEFPSEDGRDEAGDEETGAEQRELAQTVAIPADLNPPIVDQMPVALLIHSGDILHHANPEFLALTGYASLESLHAEGGIDALFVAPEDEQFELPEGSMMLIRDDGHLVAVNARLQSIRWQGRTALMMALSPSLDPVTAAPHAGSPGVLTGTNDNTSAVEALRIEADELHSILETATDGVVTIGAEGDIRSMNRSASALFNYDEAETRGKPFAMLFAHESQKAVLDYLNGLSGHGVASVLNDGREVIGRESNGGFIPLFMTMGRLSSSNGYCAVIRDITQWKRTEEELRNAKRAAETANAHKTEFLARVSHEIRTPLNAIIGFSDMMASERLGPIGHPRYQEYSSDIGRSGRHVLDIVNDLLDISKIEAGEMDLEFTAVSLNETVSEAVALVQPQANAQRVIIRTSLSNSVPDVVADIRSIKQIALNILANAIRFTPAGGQIVVSTAYEANGSVVLRIRDTGVGMARAELEQALKPFRQVPNGARKQRGDGTGLGLPLTKAMVDANRAHFAISSAPNEGTLVEVSFPSQRVLAD